MTVTETASRSQLIRELSRQVQHLERSARQPELNDAPTTIVSTGIAAVDDFFPEGGLRRGLLIEWLIDGEGTGACRLMFQLVSRFFQAIAAGAVVVIDRQREFYPPAMAAAGVDVDRAVLVRPQKQADALWALEQSLRSAGVTVTVCRINRLIDRAFRRLQLAAETGQGLGMLLRPAEARAQPSWADVRFLVRPLAACASFEESSGQRLSVELLHRRGGAGGGVVELELCDETGLVRAASELADSARLSQAAGA